MKIHSKSLWLYFIPALLISVISGCSEIDRGGLQPSTGGTNELIVVTNSDENWNGRMGQTIREFFGKDVPGLPQPEPMFNLVHISEPNFSKMLQTHHNIFIVDINDKFTKPLLETKKDLWASPQRVVKMTVPDKDTFFKEFNKNKEAFLELFHSNERRRVNEAYGSIEDYKITNLLKKKYDIDILIPKSFYIAVEKKNFVWLRREAERFSQGIIIYTYPYTDTIAFNYNRILEIRDSITKKYIPGPSEGSFMKVSTVELPVMKRIEFNGMFAVEMRGLWELDGDFMGGPFLNLTLVDEPRHRVVTVDGFVYNPSQEKRDLVRQLEALIYTLSFPDSTAITPEQK